MNHVGWHLIAYDISADRARRRVHRRLLREATAVQFSVFLIHCDDQRLRELLDELEGEIDATTDDVRTYPVGDPADLWLNGPCEGLKKNAGRRPARASLVFVLLERLSLRGRKQGKHQP